MPRPLLEGVDGAVMRFAFMRRLKLGSESREADARSGSSSSAEPVRWSSERSDMAAGDCANVSRSP
eukprot:4812033-Prymnesium_polylepis.1